MLKAGVPDNVIGPRDAPWLIVDAKYKNPLRESWGKEYFHNEDLYQAFTYAAALDAPAVLVYPRVDRDVDVTVHVQGQLVRVAQAELAESPHAAFRQVVSEALSAASTS